MVAVDKKFDVLLWLLCLLTALTQAMGHQEVENFSILHTRVKAGSLGSFVLALGVRTVMYTRYEYNCLTVQSLTLVWCEINDGSSHPSQSA